jgi:hypothetical protein
MGAPARAVAVPAAIGLAGTTGDSGSALAVWGVVCAFGGAGFGAVFGNPGEGAAVAGAALGVFGDSAGFAGAGFASAGFAGAGFAGAGFAGAGFGTSSGALAAASASAGAAAACALGGGTDGGPGGGSDRLTCASPPMPLRMWIMCSHLRHFIRRARPAAFSSAIWYFALQFGQMNFIDSARTDDSRVRRLAWRGLEPKPAPWGMRVLLGFSATRGFSTRACDVGMVTRGTTAHRRR